MRDPELAVIFTEMRRASGVTKEQIAGRLATGVDTIEALEEGALAELPDWNEVRRIVTAYAAQLGLDSRPILRRMQVRLGVTDEAAHARRPRPEPAPPRPQAAAGPAQGRGGPPMPPSARARQQPPAPPRQPPKGPPKPNAAQARPAPPPRQPDAAMAPGPGQPQPQTIQPHTTVEPDAPAEQRRRGRAARFMKGLVNWLLLVGFVAALGIGIWYAVKNPRTVWSAFDAMPEPIPQMMRAAWEMVRPLEDGPGGPPASDPERRRSNKLP